MNQNEKLMTAMVKKPPGVSGGGGGAGGGDGGRKYKVPLCSEWKVSDNHPYNGKTLQTFKHCRKIDIHANDECFDLESNTHLRPTYWKKGKRK